ncbi:MAG: hypothetical protein HC769_35900 [Cyanobacteria bacterium CRU_2_1]|nr:hypothetical protein [Cyanobacteria bacterium CRU_2_1]
MQSRMKLGTIEPTTFRTIFQSLTNWLTGIFLILLGLYHNLAGGSLIGQWLQSLNPPISPNDVNMGQLGFEMGGYLAMAIGLTFIMFSPLEVGKKWFYSELEKLANLETRTGNDTYEMRQSFRFEKSKNKAFQFICLY